LAGFFDEQMVRIIILHCFIFFSLFGFSQLNYAPFANSDHVLLTESSFYNNLTVSGSNDSTKHGIFSKSHLLECTDFKFGINNYNHELHFLRNTLRNTGQALTAPLYWQQKQWIKFGLFAAATTTLFYFDEDLYLFVEKNRNNFTHTTTRYVLEPLGNYTTFALMAGMAGYGIITQKQRPLNTSILALQSLIITSGITLLPKNLLGRVRPIHTYPLSSTQWLGPFEGKSFWSGHTAAAFSVATVIAEMYKDEIPVIPYIAYSTAALAGISRIHDNKHWPSDVFVGALVGMAVSKMVVKNYRKSYLKLYPVVSQHHTGLSLSYNLSR
jgi:membrane-associated phospholipid phosphatase